MRIRKRFEQCKDIDYDTLIQKKEQVIVVVVFLDVGFCQVIVLQPDIMLSYSDIKTL